MTTLFDRRSFFVPSVEWRMRRAFGTKRAAPRPGERDAGLGLIEARLGRVTLYPVGRDGPEP